MKGRTILFSLLLISAVFMVMSDMSQRARAQTLLIDDTPVMEGVPIPDYYQFDVLSEDHAVIGMRPEAGDDFDIEVYEDTTFATMIESSTTIGDAVDFVVLDKTAWSSPPSRGARVTSGTTSYVVEIENDMDDHSIGDTWSGSMGSFSGNPVLDIGPPGSWDDVYVAHPTVHYDGTTYHIWYGGLGSNVKIGYATSPDGITWTKYAGNPVLDLGLSGFWDDFGVHYPTVIYNGTGYQMWFSGNDGTHYRIGYATSSDGITWTKNPTNPVLNLGPSGSFDDFYVAQPSVIYDGTTYHMWYSGLNSVGYGRTGYATSPDGVTWTKSAANPVLDIGPSGSWDGTRAYSPEVIYEGGTYHMWYSGYDGSTYRIGYATSSDGIAWTKYAANPLLDRGPPGSWEDVHLGSPTVLYDGTTFHMWYTGDDGANVRIGYATSPDGINWTKFEFAEVLDAYEITGITAGSTCTFTLAVPPTADLDLFIYDTTGGRDDAIVSSTNPGSGIDESITFIAPTTGDYLLVITNENGGRGIYVISFTDTPPVITDITTIPNPQEVFGASNISANVTDDHQLFGVWVEIYDSSGSFVGNFSMLHDPVNGRYYWNQTYDILGTYSFTIWANDTSNNWASASDTFVIQDTTPPVITDITAIPDPQEVFSSVNVSANVTDNYQLYRVWVVIFDPGGGFVGNFSMLYDPVNDRYYWNQTYNLLGTYTFTIWANDTSNNWALASDTFVIQDTTPPMIINVTAIPSPQEVFYAVNISANITDNYKVFGAWVEIHYPNGSFLGNFSLHYDEINGKYFWNQTYDLLGTYTFTIWANDTSDNWASVSDTFVIRDTTPPVIINVTAIPNPQEVFGEVNISANITDNYKVFGAWVEIYYPNGSFMGNFSLLYDEVYGKYYWDQSYNLLGTYTFIIWANDMSDNWASSSDTFVVHDKTPPKILNVTAIPSPQEVFYAVNISANVTDNYKVFGAWVEIYYPNGSSMGNFSLLYDEVDGKYYWNQSYNLLGTYTFTIWANDTSDNWASESDTFVIRDMTPPMIINITAMPNPQEVFYAVNISAHVTDNYRVYGAWVEIHYPNGSFMGNFSLLYDEVDGKYFWNQTYGLLGTYTFTIWANDTSDNWASASDTFVIHDTTPPVIINVTAIPNPQEVFYAVNTSANITDNYKVFGAWVEIYYPNGSFMGNFSLYYDVVDGKYYWNQSYNLLGIYSFIIWANDTSNNWASTLDTFVIQDTTPPSITDITAIPDPQEIFHVVNVSADIIDNYQLYGAWVEIYDPIGGFVGNYSMLYDSVNGRYYWNQTYGLLGTYTFIIWANDTSDNWASASDTFVIRDTTPPVIINVTAIPNPQEVFGEVNISANITDNYKVFGAWVEIYYHNGSFMGNFSLLYDEIDGKYYWNQTYDIIGTYMFTIWANDTSNNWATTSDTFVIHDKTPPTINDVTAIPDPQKLFRAVKISANVTDNYQLFGVWVEIFDSNWNIVGNFSMSYEPVNGRYYCNQTYDMVGNYNFTIWANDTSDNWASALGSFIILPTLSPSITNVTAEPAPQIVGEEVTISATVTDEDTDLDDLIVKIYITRPDGMPIGNFTMAYNLTINKYTYTSDFDMKGTYSFVIWANDPECNWAKEEDTFVMEPKSEPREYNWKPIIALIFTIILLILGILVSYNRPIKFMGVLEKDRWYTFLLGVLPYAIAEAITGIISLLTGLLSVPPILGVGMIVDLIILIAGIISCIIIYKKGTPLEAYEEETQPPTRQMPPQQPAPPEIPSQSPPPPPGEPLPPPPPPSSIEREEPS